MLQTWNPKSKSEPYAQSAVELMRLAKETVNNFFGIPIGITDDLILDLAEGLEQLVQEYTTFVASCGENHGNVSYTILSLLVFMENFKSSLAEKINDMYTFLIFCHILFQGQSRVISLHFLL